MMLRKKYVVAISSLVIISVLVGSLFYYNMVQAQEAHEYDPWADTNDDGLIDIRDITHLAMKFGTSGDPTKSVEIAERRIEENAIDYAIELGTHVNITIPTAGFRIIAVSIWVYSLPTRYFDMFVGYRAANRFLNSSLITQFTDYPIIIIQPEWYENIREPKFSWTEEVWFSELVITIINSHSENVMTGSVVYYLST